MNDSESLTNNDNLKFDSRPDSLGDMFAGLFKASKIKMGAFIFLIFILLNSTIYFESILSKFPNAVDSIGQPTDKGIGISAMIIALACILLDILVQYGVI